MQRIASYVLSILCLALAAGCYDIPDTPNPPDIDPVDTTETYAGIKTTEDLCAWADSISNSRDTRRFRKDSTGAYILLSDIDLSGVDKWRPVGSAEHPFEDVFDGQGHTVKGADWSFDLAKQSYIGMFGYVGKATISDFSFEGKISAEGLNSEAVFISAIAAFVDGATFSKIDNKADVALKSEGAAGFRICVGGVCGFAQSKADFSGCSNSGSISTGKVANTGNGSTGVQTAGIVAYAQSAELDHCLNSGHISCPAGREGGVVGTMVDGKMHCCTNEGLVEDDIVGQFTTTDYNVKRMGGLLGGTISAAVQLDSCLSSGTVITHIGCRAGGFAGHFDKANCKACTHSGEVRFEGSGTLQNSTHGPAWAMGYMREKTQLSACVGKGKVQGVDDLAANAIASDKTLFNYEDNTITTTSSDALAYEVVESAQLHKAVKYSKLKFKWIPRNICLMELDMTDPSIEIIGEYADDIVPNPNANKNSNNGFKVRETLSQLCERKRAAGMDVIGGVNAGFFDSNDGFGRGLLVSGGAPVFVNNPSTRSSAQHLSSFSVFSDASVSCGGEKAFTGMISTNGGSFAYHSVNDTILRHGSSSYPANIYTCRYKEYPHPTELPTVTNPLCKNALYLVCRKSGCIPAKVNAEWESATVEAIYDGRSTALEKAPYLSEPDQFALQLIGSPATIAAKNLSVGSSFRIRADLSIDNERRELCSCFSSSGKIIEKGVPNSRWARSDSKSYNPRTFVFSDAKQGKVWIATMDGRQEWISWGMTYFEMAAFGQLFGAADMTCFDGGGSTVMWIWEKGAGRVANTPCDSNGERSNMDYLLVCVK